MGRLILRNVLMGEGSFDQSTFIGWRIKDACAELCNTSLRRKKLDDILPISLSKNEKLLCKENVMPHETNPIHTSPEEYRRYQWPL